MMRVRRNKGEREVERPPRPRRHRRRQPEGKIHDDEPLDLEPLQVKMPNEDMQEPLTETEVATKDAAYVKDQILDFHNLFEGHSDPDVFPQ
ncbi:hypothetical protein TSUD_91700 [Trifolium subterraneum]|uniref:Uncharacterized protein n=1 Tax=Trifolium subterraneum TaxID=3900 RepID=A0A2Z6NJ99_TRISU|nr:hypothetical protein TSUD_91700 [Trifolium subterraneum]